MKNSYKILILVLLLCIGNALKSQVVEEKYDLCPPLKIPMTFAGNFGELRETHFHSGVDFKTNGKEGYRIYCSENGYVSRILVSSSGYGNAVYVTHSNGLMTVYGHLKNFNKKIAKYVKYFQYKNESWEIDERLPKNLIKVQKGEKIGLSGNTGSSMGPHLHYEIRDVQSGEIINPLLYFDAKDNIRPKISKLYVYSLDDDARYYDANVAKYRVINKGSRYRLHNDTLHLSGKVGFGLKVRDFMNNSWNKFGLYAIKSYVNDSLVYYYKMDRFSFGNTKCVNLVKDFREDLLHKSKVYKTWLPVNTDLETVRFAENRGEVELKENNIYNLRLEVSDLHGNESVLRFVVKADTYRDTIEDVNAGVKLYSDRDNTVECGRVRLNIPKGALFCNVDIDTLTYKSDDSLLCNSSVYRIGKEFIPMKKKFEVCMKVDEELSDKKYIVRKSDNGRIHFVGGRVKNGELVARTATFGDFAVKMDTVSPIIQTTRRYGRSWLRRHSVIRLKVVDEDTGVFKYRAEINGQWVWCKYDAKKNQLVCVFRKEQLIRGRKNKFIVTVQDACDNKSIYKQNFVF